MTPADWRRQRHFGSLDGLRGLSILAVMLFHAAAPLGFDPPWVRLGHMGVDLFFVISGFLITTLLLRDRDATGTVRLRRFYVRRALRIFPLYYVVIALYVVVVLATVRSSHPAEAARFFANLPYFLTYTSNWFVHLEPGTRTIFYFAWSLAAEEQFYLVWPPLLALLRGLRAPAAVALATLGVVVGARHGLWLATPGFLRTVVTEVPPAILVGVLLGLGLHANATHRALRFVFGRRGSATTAFAALGLAWHLRSEAGLPAEVVVLAMGGLVASSVVREDNDLATLWRWRPLAALGLVSYGVYLLHYLVLNVLERLLPRLGVAEPWLAAVGVPALVLGAWAAARVSWELLEQPLLRLKDRWAV